MRPQISPVAMQAADIGHQWVLCLDDDVMVHPHTLQELVRGMSHQDAFMATGPPCRQALPAFEAHRVRIEGTCSLLAAAEGRCGGFRAHGPQRDLMMRGGRHSWAGLSAGLRGSRQQARGPWLILKGACGEQFGLPRIGDC